ncbi:MAG: uncharacterized protein KVP18_004468 [Porospora cf. gigantea A]|uniref:uncharacterized protein n=1 Tax=Porospora cf. gigantea A TaxID=2853593 RepID=UPI00355ACA06|nr:MAG: hypothetical protein KVP18_004468 [Porospora cf. gigantea A]
MSYAWIQQSRDWKVFVDGESAESKDVLLIDGHLIVSEDPNAIAGSYDGHTKVSRHFSVHMSLMDGGI